MYRLQKWNVQITNVATTHPSRLVYADQMNFTSPSSEKLKPGLMSNLPVVMVCSLLIRGKDNAITPSHKQIPLAVL